MNTRTKEITEMTEEQFNAAAKSEMKDMIPLPENEESQQMMTKWSRNRVRVYKKYLKKGFTPNEAFSKVVVEFVGI